MFIEAVEKDGLAPEAVRPRWIVVVAVFQFGIQGTIWFHMYFLVVKGHSGDCEKIVMSWAGGVEL